MDTLDAMRVFVTVVDRNGFNAAAEALGMSTASVTRQVAWLEKRLGLRLLNRTTRRVSPSSVGTAYYQRCQVLLAEFDDMEAAVGEQALTPSGTLRINAPFSFAIARLGPRLAGYRVRHPQVALDLSLSDRLVDIVEEGYDMAIRITRQVGPSATGKFALGPASAWNKILSTAVLTPTLDRSFRVILPGKGFYGSLNATVSANAQQILGRWTCNVDGNWKSGTIVLNRQ